MEHNGNMKWELIRKDIGLFSTFLDSRYWNTSKTRTKYEWQKYCHPNSYSLVRYWDSFHDIYSSSTTRCYYSLKSL